MDNPGWQELEAWMSEVSDDGVWTTEEFALKFGINMQAAQATLWGWMQEGRVERLGASRVDAAGRKRRKIGWRTIARG